MSTTREATRPTLPARPADPRAERRPFRDNPRLILLGILVLIAALVAMVRFADSSTELNPDFLTEVVLYALSAADLTMLVALVFVLARNIVKLVVERRRGLPFSRFRAKLVLALLGLTLVPCVLVLIVGSELIRSSTEKWFSQPIDDVLGAATKIAQDYYRDRADAASPATRRGSRARFPVAAVESGDLVAVRRAIEAEVAQGRVGLVEVYRSRSKAGQRADVVPLVAVESSGPAAAASAPPPTSLASLVASGGGESYAPEPLEGGGELVRGGAAVRDASGRVVGVVLASDYLSGESATHARQIIEAFQNRSQLRALRRPIRGVYLTLFVMMTLMIMVSATWTGLYLAKRITRPVQRLAAGAREIGAGHLDHRIEPETRDEFGSLVEAFNTMAGELAASQRKLERSRLDLERKNQQLDERRQYIETVLERIATGVVSLGPDGQIETINGAALRLLEVDRSVIGARAEDVCRREDLKPLETLLAQTRIGRPGAGGAGNRAPPRGTRVAPRRGGDAAPARRRHGRRRGPRLRRRDAAHPDAARGGVARRGAAAGPRDQEPADADSAVRRAHAPPVQHGAGAGARARRGMHVDDRRRGRVAEGARRRVRAVRQDAGAARGAGRSERGARRDAGALQRSLPRDSDRAALRARAAAGARRPRADATRGHQPRRQRRRGARRQRRRVAVRTARRRRSSSKRATMPGNGVARILVSDNGPGISAADRDKLFMPYYSTKRRGSGLGLAIVRRIIAEHGGSIEVADNVPNGTVFTIELPT